MRALTVVPGSAGSTRLDDVGEPPLEDGPVLVQTLAIGVCGTDTEIVSGKYGWSPPGHDRLIIGHESLGRVIEAPTESGLTAGDLVVGIVRRPDPVPCSACAVDEWDMCRNGQYTERGIKQLDGFCSERYRILPKYAVKVDPSLGTLGVLLEPASVVAKAWAQVDAIGSREGGWSPKSALVTGAGPIGLLAALILHQHGLDVHVLDQATDGPKPALVHDLGATYHSGTLDSTIEVDVVIECTGVGQLVFDVMSRVSPGGVVCLTGVSSGGRELSVDAGALNRTLVLENETIVGSVNANRRHYEMGAGSLAAADKDWLSRLITRRVPLDRWESALTREPTDVKVVLELGPSI